MCDTNIFEHDQVKDHEESQECAAWIVFRRICTGQGMADEKYQQWRSEPDADALSCGGRH